MSASSPEEATAAVDRGGSKSPRTRPLGALGALLYSLGNLGMGAFYALNNADLTQWLRAYTNNASLIGLLGASHSFEGVIIQPIVGALSDRLRSPIGRRRPFLLMFVPISCLFLAVVPAAAHLPAQARLAGIAACVLLATIAFNVANDPYQALLADVTTDDERGRVTALWYFLGALGEIAVLMLPSRVPIAAKFGITAAIMLLCMGVTCASTREDDPRTLEPEQRQSFKERAALASRCTRTFRQANLYLLMYMVYGAGIDAIVPNLTSFVRQITGCTPHVADTTFLVLMAATAVGVLPSGWLSDRLGNRRLLMVGVFLVGLASLAGLWVKSLLSIDVVLGVAGIGSAMQNASSFPLLTRLVPDRHMGLYAGLQTAAVSVCGPAMILLAGQLVNHAGYRTIFAVSFVCCSVGMFFLKRIDVEKAQVEMSQEGAIS